MRPEHHLERIEQIIVGTEDRAEECAEMAAAYDAESAAWAALIKASCAYDEAKAELRRAVSAVKVSA